MILNSLLSYFRVKKLNREIKQKKAGLLVFSKIDIDEKHEKLCHKIKAKKYKDITNEFLKLLDMIKAHNQKVENLEGRFDEILKKDSYENILKNIKNYSLEDLQKINEIAISINGYKIPNNFSKKIAYTRYFKDLGELINNYQSILIQSSLIKEYNEFSLDSIDRYIDKNEAKIIEINLQKKIDEIVKYGDKYYKIPVIDDKIFDTHNISFLEKHIDDVIFDNINGRKLDFDQRKAVLYDPKSSLIVAGAGAGKTLTICGKVKYLLDNKFCSSDEILLLSYSSASANDLAEKVEKINTELKVKTFHALGLEILNRYSGVRNTIEEQFAAYIRKYFDEQLTKDKNAMRDVFTFYSMFLYHNDTGKKEYKDDGEKFEDLKKQPFKTLKDKLKSLKDENTFETVQNEFVKSYEELVIANYLFINGIKYEYERSYEVETSTPEKRQYTPDFYLTDYGIYIEHYGIDRNNHTPQYTKEEEVKYLEGIDWKRKTHLENNTKCIETYSYEFSEGTIFDNLQKRLSENGVELKPLDDKEMSDALNSVFYGQEFSSLLNLISTFVNLYKSQYSDEFGFDRLLNEKFSTRYDSERASLFLRICKSVFCYYREELKKQNKIDFDDMILQSINVLDSLKEYKYKYIIVDEFQDISQSRTRFLQKLIEHGNSKLFAVGDDWQAIYRFAGCDINVFLKFNEYFDDVKINYITSTHRNSAELQAIVEPFITANPEQFKKHINSEIHQKEPVRIIYYNNDRAFAFTKALNDISKINDKAKVLVLGRNRHDVDSMISNEIQVKNYTTILHNRFKKMEIEYKTVHQSKGIERDFVVLISGEDAKNGFPNKMEDDILLNLLLGDNSPYEYAEERRLFYVALTRTKSIVYILSNKKSPSAFVKEIEEMVDIDNIENSEETNNNYLCPWCKSGHLVLRETEDKRSFYGCSNFPYCKYTINDLKAVKVNNRCPDCGDYLVIRNGKNGRFIGCHSYPRCNYTRHLQDNNSRYRDTKIGFRE